MAKYKFEDIAINSKLKKKPVEEDKYHYIGLEHLDSGSLEVTRYGSEVAPKGEKLIMKKGDVLFGKRRAYQKKVGIAPFDGIFSAHGMVLRPKENVINKKFFPLFISSDYFLDAAIKISVGSLSPTINWSDLKELEFELPDLEGQKKLAKILWAAEETKQAYKKLLQKTDDLVRAKFEEMFGKAKRDYLGNYIEQIRGVSYKPTDLNSQLVEGYITLLRANNISDGVINFDEVQYVNRGRVYDNQLIKPKDILMCASSGSLEHVGKTALCNLPMEYTFGAFCKLIRANDMLKPEYIFSYMNTQEYRDIIENVANGANINNLRNEDIENILIPIPSDEQQVIFINFWKQTEQSKQQLQKSLDSLNAMTKALINENLK